MVSSSLQGGCEPTFDLLWSPENTKGVVSFEPPLGVTLVSPVDACGFEHLCLVLLVSSNSVPEKESNGYWGGCTKLSCTRVSEYLDLCIVCTSWHFVQKTTQSQPVQNLMFQLSEIFWEYSGFISGNKKIARYRLWIYGQFIFQNEMSFTNLQQLSRFHSAGRVTAVSLWGPMWMVAVLNAGKMKLIERSIVAWHTRMACCFLLEMLVLVWGGWNLIWLRMTANEFDYEFGWCWNMINLTQMQ